MLQELAILAGVGGLTAAGVAGIYLATREKAPAPSPAAPAPQPVPGYVPNPLMFPVGVQMPAARQEPLTSPPPAQPGLASWLQFGSSALQQLPGLVNALGGAFTAPTATASPVPAGPAGTVQAGYDYAAFAQQYAANQIAIDAARQAAVSSWGGSAVETSSDFGNVSDAVWAY